MNEIKYSTLNIFLFNINHKILYYSNELQLLIRS